MYLHMTQMHEVDAPSNSNKNKCVGCCKCSNIKSNIFGFKHDKKICASS